MPMTVSRPCLLITGRLHDLLNLCLAQCSHIHSDFIQSEQCAQIHMGYLLLLSILMVIALYLGRVY
jgi:hypothetical protein